MRKFALADELVVLAEFLIEAERSALAVLQNVLPVVLRLTVLLKVCILQDRLVVFRPSRSASRV